VRLDPSTLGDYFTPGFWCPLNPGVTVTYLSRRLVDAETRYTFIKKLCLCLFYTCTKCRCYLLSSYCTISGQTDVIKYMLQNPIISGRIGKWAYALIEYVLAYEPLKFMKGQVVEDFIVEHQIDDTCWGEGEDATLRSRPSLQSLVQQRQDNGQGRPSPDTTSDEDLRRGRPTVRPRRAWRPTCDPAHCNGPCVAAACYGPNL
jgi:hypothetical protein